MIKKIAIPAIVLTIGTASLFAGMNAFAQGENASGQTIVQKIAQRFNLDETEVQSVFDDEKNERRAQMQMHIEEKLNQAVADGKISESQKQVILAKFAEMKEKKKADFEQFRNMTKEQRDQTVVQKKSKFESWAKQNGIDLSILSDLFGHKERMSGGWHMH